MDPLMIKIVWHVMFVLGCGSLEPKAAAERADKAVNYLETHRTLTLREDAQPGARPADEDAVLGLVAEILAADTDTLPPEVAELKRRIAEETAAGRGPKAGDLVLPPELRQILTEFLNVGARAAKQPRPSGSPASADAPPTGTRTRRVYAMRLGDLFPPRAASGSPGMDPFRLLDTIERLIVTDAARKGNKAHARAEDSARQMQGLLTVVQIQSDTLKTALYALTEPRGFWVDLLKTLRGAA